LLNPQVRFFVFEFIAFLGILSWVYYKIAMVGYLSLTAWWFFSLNFFVNYEEFLRTHKMFVMSGQESKPNMKSESKKIISKKKKSKNKSSKNVKLKK
jgi:hypothetical protein